MIAFVMDPLERVVPATDTSFALMLAAQQRGHDVLHVDPMDISLRGDEVYLAGSRVELRDEPRHHFRILQKQRIAASDLRAIFIRTDPPFDQAYMTVTWLLSFAENRGVRIINSPRGLRSANEKLYALEFAALCPETLVSSDRDEIVEFVKGLGGDAVAKPVDGHGGFGVVRLREGDSNLRPLIDMLSKEGREPFLVQEYVAAGTAGDKRLFVIDGELRAAVLRVPANEEHRSNVHVGGSVQPAELDTRDHEIVDVMRSRLEEDGLFFAGIDVIGGRLIEVNVTSPTLVRELVRVGGPDLASEMIAAVETN